MHVTERKNHRTYIYLSQVAGFPILSCGKYWLANSISYWLGLNGPSFVVDTACSSSQSAMIEAYRMIRNGECDAAIVGGSNLCLHPNITLQLVNLGKIVLKDRTVLCYKFVIVIYA